MQTGIFAAPHKLENRSHVQVHQLLRDSVLVVVVAAACRAYPPGLWGAVGILVCIWAVTKKFPTQQGVFL